MTGAALRFDAVRFAYGAVPVLNGVGFIVPAGRVVALMGPSGCGKSTVLLLAAGLLRPVSGTVACDGGRIAMAFQDPLLLPWRTALDNVAFALRADGLPRRQRRMRAAAMLDRVGLAEAEWRKYPRQLSGGMRQRVALARALVIGPDLLLLDEAFSALDKPLAARMHALLRDTVMADGTTVLAVTHDAVEADAIADEIVTLTAPPARVLGRVPVRRKGGGPA